MQVDGELGVDEDESAVIERAADPVPRVGRDQHPGERGDRLAPDQRKAHAQPGDGGPLLEEGAAHERGLHSRVVASVVSAGEERDLAALVGSRRSLGQWRILDGELGGADAHHLATQDLFVAGGEHA